MFVANCEEKLQQRSLDPDENVREKVVESVFKAAVANPSSIQVKTLKMIADRARDKKVIEGNFPNKIVVGNSSNCNQEIVFSL
jgi:hypothetical protein